MIDFDFHTHTYPQSNCASQTVEELVKKAHSAGIKVLAVCNHDTLEGLSEARAECNKYGIEFVNGVELTCDIEGESKELNGAMIHILGLNIDNNAEIFNSYFADMRAKNEKRVLRICAFLRGKGLNIDDCTQLKELWAQMVEKNGYPDIKRARKYIYSYEIELKFPTARLSHRKAIELIHKLNGFAVWAHPTRVYLHDNFSVEEITEVTDRLCACGLDGLEVFHPDNFKEGAIPALLNIAVSRNLKATLGSDSHYVQDKDGYFPLNDGLDKFDYDFRNIKYFWKNNQ